MEKNVFENSFADRWGALADWQRETKLDLIYFFKNRPLLGLLVIAGLAVVINLLLKILHINIQGEYLSLAPSLIAGLLISILLIVLEADYKYIVQAVFVSCAFTFMGIKLALLLIIVYSLAYIEFTWANEDDEDKNSNKDEAKPKQPQSNLIPTPLSDRVVL